VGEEFKMKYHSNIWYNMLSRCYKKTAHNYKWYGAIGVTVCQEWRDSLHVFTADMGNRPSPKHTLDRIDNTGEYSKTNCRWSTSKENNNNRRDSGRKELVDGEMLTAQDCMKKYGITYTVFSFYKCKKKLNFQQTVDARRAMRCPK
jgi:hypothetical protein